MRQYVKEHQVEPLLAEALKAACDAGAPDPVTFIGEFMLAKRAATRVPKNGDADGEDNVTVYLRTGAFGIARQRTGWLLFFLFGLLLCANVMREFEHLLAKELELAFFVPLLIGHGGNSGGQTVSTVIRALGSGAATLSDAPRVVFKEAAAGVMQSIVLACVLAPTIHTTMGISIEVTTIVGLTLPCESQPRRGGSMPNVRLPLAMTAGVEAVADRRILPSASLCITAYFVSDDPNGPKRKSAPPFARLAYASARVTCERLESSL